MEILIGVIGSLLAQLILVLGMHFFRRAIFVRTGLALVRFGLGTQHSLGICDIHRNIEEAKQLLQDHFDRSSCIKFKAIRGLGWFGVGGIFEDQLARMGQQRTLQVLLLTPNSSWRSPHKSVGIELTSAHRIVKERIAAITGLSEESGVRFYTSNPTWRIIITDERGFVSPYTLRSEMDKVPILELSCESILLEIFKRDFDFHWAISDRSSALQATAHNTA